jgi:hypothetical protein
VRRTIGAGRAAGRRDGTVVGRETARVAGPVTGSIVERFAGPVGRPGRDLRGARTGAPTGVPAAERGLVLDPLGRVIVVVLMWRTSWGRGRPLPPGRSLLDLSMSISC